MEEKNRKEIERETVKEREKQESTFITKQWEEKVSSKWTDNSVRDCW